MTILFSIISIIFCVALGSSFNKIHKSHSKIIEQNQQIIELLQNKE